MVPKTMSVRGERAFLGFEGEGRERMQVKRALTSQLEEREESLRREREREREREGGGGGRDEK